MVEMKNASKILVWKPKGKRLLGIPGCRWEDYIKMDLKVAGYEGVGWIYLIQKGIRSRLL
jgi:hypothetical protein